MSGKLSENVDVKNLFSPERIGAVSIYYNGQAITTGSGIGIDTQGYDDAVVSINVGTILGPYTLRNTVLASETDSPAAATAISLATFTDRNGDNDETIEIGSVRCAGQKRYLFLKTEVQGIAGTVPTIDFGAQCILGKADTVATSATYNFDV